MCINARMLPSGALVPCHSCWQCRSNRINDWVGRCIAERETAVASTVVTLTYGGGDTPQSRFLRKSDITQYMKAIRNAGHKVRHFAVGEYGSLKGRAHWHIVLFWQSPMPHRDMRKMVDDEFWPHGHTLWDEADGASIRYVMKYINKDISDNAAQNALSMSKKPMLGTDFFYDLAGRYVDSGLSPQKPYYKFKDVLDLSGKPQLYYMPPLVCERFIAMFIARWKLESGKTHWPSSELVDKYHDKMAGYLPPLRFEKRQFREGPWMLPPDGSKPRFDEKLNSFYALIDGRKLFWSFDERGQRAWRDEVVTETEATSRQAAYVA